MGWKTMKEGVFSIRYAYTILQNSLSAENTGMFNSCWSVKVLPNAQHFGWRVILDKIPTKVNLVRRGVSLGASLCELRNESEKNVIHLFFYCKIAKRVGEMCDKWVRVTSVNHNQAKVHFQHFHLIPLNGKQNRIWKEM